MEKLLPSNGQSKFRHQGVFWTVNKKALLFYLQVHSPVDSATMSPVERTAAWVLNNGQYEQVEEEAEQNPDEANHTEKVTVI